MSCYSAFGLRTWADVISTPPPSFGDHGKNRVSRYSISVLQELCILSKMIGKPGSRMRKYVAFRPSRYIQPRAVRQKIETALCQFRPVFALQKTIQFFL